MRASNFQDLTGQKFGRWAVLELDPTPSYATRWVCICSCEKRTVKSVAAPTLVGGTSTSCGCSWSEKRKSNSPHWKGCGELPAAHWTKIKHHAKTRNIEVQMTIEDAWAVFEHQNGLCALTGEKLQFGFSYRVFDTTASLDRIDSAGCYRVGNVQWVHKDINTAKWDFSTDKFIEICYRVVNHQEMTKPFRKDDE